MVALNAAHSWLDEFAEDIRETDVDAGGNRLYTVAAITNQTGQVVERYKYDTYGKQTCLAANGTVSYAPSDYGQFVGFTGRYHDGETGLVYFRARYFDAGLGRFIGRDTVRVRRALLSDGTIRIGQPTGGDGYLSGTNLYQAYFAPNRVDPTGWVDCPPPDAVAKSVFSSDKLKSLFPNPDKAGISSSAIYDAVSDQVALAEANDLTIGFTVTMGAGIGALGGRVVTAASKGFIKDKLIQRGITYAGAAAGGAVGYAMTDEKTVSGATGEWGKIKFEVVLLPSQTDCTCCYLVIFRAEGTPTEMTMKICTEKGEANPSWNPWAKENIFKGKTSKIFEFENSDDQVGKELGDYSHTGGVEIDGSFDGTGLTPPNE